MFNSSPTPATVMAVYGTRSEAISLAPLLLALRADPRFEVLVTVAGRDGDMPEQAHRDFGIAPDHDLDRGGPIPSLARLNSRMLEGLTEVLRRERPDAVLVQGRTTTTFMGALAAFGAGIPVIHAQADLPPATTGAPLLEETNRRLTSQIASLHLVPTAAGREKLLRENIDASSIVVTGDCVIDALLLTVASRPRIEDPDLDQRLAQGRPVLLVTLGHREPRALGAVGRALAALARRHPDHDVVVQAHHDPLVRDILAPAVRELPNVLLTEPLPYAQSCALLERSSVILTDGPEAQETGPSLGKPVLVLGETTEHPEAVAAGTVRLIGTDEDAVVDEVSALLADRVEYRRMLRALNPYGDGRAAERALHALTRYFGLPDAPRYFEPDDCFEEFGYAAPLVEASLIKAPLIAVPASGQVPVRMSA